MHEATIKKLLNTKFTTRINQGYQQQKITKGTTTKCIVRQLQV